MELRVSEKSVFPTTVCVAILKIFCSYLKKGSSYILFYATSDVCRYAMMAFSFLLTATEENGKNLKCSKCYLVLTFVTLEHTF